MHTSSAYTFSAFSIQVSPLPMSPAAQRRSGGGGGSGGFRAGFCTPWVARAGSTVGRLERRTVKRWRR